MTPDDTTPSPPLQRQIDILTGKVEKVDYKVDEGFKSTTALLLEKLTSFERQSEINQRNTQQSIELIVVGMSSNQTEIQGVDKSLAVHKASTERDLEALRVNHEALADNFKWLWRTVVGGFLIAIIGAGVTALFAFL